MSYTIRELADIKKVHPKTFSRYIKKVAFKKKSVGRFYSVAEAEKLSKLLDFEMPKLNGHKRT